MKIVLKHFLGSNYEEGGGSKSVRLSDPGWLLQQDISTLKNVFRISSGILGSSFNCDPLRDGC